MKKQPKNKNPNDLSLQYKHSNDLSLQIKAALDEEESSMGIMDIYSPRPIFDVKKQLQERDQNQMRSRRA